MRIESSNKTDEVKQEGIEKPNEKSGGTGYGDLALNKKLLHRDILRLVTAILLVLAVIAASAVLFVWVRTYYRTARLTDNYTARAAVVEDDLKNNLAAVNDKFAVERLQTFFEKGDIYVFSYDLWNYEMLVNDVPVAPSTTALTINAADKISIRETLKQTVLPAEFVSVGSLTRGDTNDSLRNHFSLSGKDYKLTENKEGNITSFSVDDIALNSGDIFYIQFSVQLQQRLGFETDKITVTVK
jgi:hypothetical protein